MAQIKLPEIKTHSEMVLVATILNNIRHHMFKIGTNWIDNPKASELFDDMGETTMELIKKSFPLEQKQ